MLDERNNWMELERKKNGRRHGMKCFWLDGRTEGPVERLMDEQKVEGVIEGMKV